MEPSDNGILQKSFFPYVSWMKGLSYAIYFASTWSESKHASVKDGELPEVQASTASLFIPHYCSSHLFVDDIAMSWCSINLRWLLLECFCIHKKNGSWKISVNAFLSKCVLVNEFTCQESALHASKLNQPEDMTGKKLLSLRCCKLDGC